ncbi:hypothetical protein AAHB37_17325 [Glutamicibacter halophytocola]|uniref:hypothetical protein n=1 Tax=Glutamicibacter halophytocola TaxID=1933880 RepID=UPI00321C1279
MSHSSPGVRIPLRLPTASATFAIAIAGYLAVNLSPYMITALQGAIGADFVAAGWIVTLVLLATAIIGLAVAPLCAGRSRMLVARGGLALGVLAFGIAAMSPSTEVMIASLLLGGAGAGGAVAASGAAFAAFANPDRVAGLNGLANRGGDHGGLGGGSDAGARPDQRLWRASALLPHRAGAEPLAAAGSDHPGRFAAAPAAARHEPRIAGRPVRACCFWRPLRSGQ